MNIYMYNHYWHSAIRNLTNQKFFSFINVLGLALGIACCLLIVLYVQYELSYDRHFPKADRIYRMTADFKTGQRENRFPLMPAPLAEVLVQDFPEVEKAGRLRKRAARLVRPEDQTENIKVENVSFADQSFIEIFDFPLAEGTLIGALSDPNTVILSQSLAHILFPEGSALNQTILINNKDAYKVTGVFYDTPENTHFSFDLYLSMETFEDSKNKVWLSHNYPTYFLLKEGTDITSVEAKIPQLFKKYIEPQLIEYSNESLEDMEANGDHMKYHIQALTNIHLTSGLILELKPGTDKRYIWLFAGIALFILLIASINFMNLSTAKSAHRAKEVGIRKVLGSHRSQLIFQFLIESMALTSIAFIIGIGISSLLIPYFNNISGREIHLPFTEPLFYLLIITMMLILGFCSGIYPAFFLSSFLPVRVLKGKLSAKSGGKWLRSFLVVFQFTTSIILIAATIAIYQQMSYIQNRSLGYDKDSVIILEDTQTLGNSIIAFQKALSQIPEVEDVSIGSFLPVDGFSRKNSMYWPEGDNTSDSQVFMQKWLVDYEYISTLDIEILAGRGFDDTYSTDSQAIVLNRTGAFNFGFSNLSDAIGQKIATYSGINAETGESEIATKTIIGIVEDFHFESLHSSIAALGMELGESTRAMSIRVNTDQFQQTLQKISAVWEQFVQNQSLEYTFLDQEFAAMYESEQKLGKLFGAFSFLAIFVACLGLFALAAFMAERRTREIGIRKVLGASSSNIVGLLSRDFIALVLVALILASPIAYYLIYQWLSDFAYRVNVQPSIFLFAGVLAVAIAFLTISYQSLRAANLEPSQTLKEE